jgi:DNA helicase HerA-like ATPase
LLLQTDKIGIFGPSGEGKTTLSKYVQRAFPRTIVVDTMREYFDSECDVRVRSVAELGSVLKITRADKLKNFRIVYQWEGVDPKEEIADFERVVELTYLVGDIHLVVEELQEYCRPGWLPPWLRRAVLTGRHKGMGITATSQRPAEVAKSFISNCRHVFAARFELPNDVAFFEKDLGKLAVNSMRNLKRFQFIHAERGQTVKLVKVP